MNSYSKIFILALLILVGCSSTITSEREPAPENKLAPVTQQTEENVSSHIQFDDGIGRRISLNSPAERIISLAPANTEMLFALGAGNWIIGRDAYSDFPPDAKKIPDLGDYYGEFNYEKIITLQPDLILLSELTPIEQINALEDLGLTVFVVANPENFEDLYKNLQLLGKMTGQEEEAQYVVQSLKERVVEVQKKLFQNDVYPLVFYELDGSEADAPWTAGPGTFIDTIIKMAGGKNLGSNLTGEWVQISVEEVISKNPEIIILGDFTLGGVTPEDVASRTGWEVIQAVQTGKVYTFDDNLVARPGPRLVEGLEKMAQLIHPELFNE